MYKQFFGVKNDGKTGVRKIAPPLRVRVWFRISVTVRAGGQFSSGAIFLEPVEHNQNFIKS